MPHPPGGATNGRPVVLMVAGLANPGSEQADTMGDTVGIIGLGLAGKALATRLLAAGHTLIGYDVAPQACVEASELGVQVVEDAAAVAHGARVIILSLPNSDIVCELLWDAPALADELAPGTLILDTTTGRPGQARENAESLAELGVRFHDVTLSGSSAQIAAGTATAMVGGSEAEADYQEIIATFADRCHFLGEPGAGCLAKLVVNHVMGLNRVALAEGLALGRRAGMEPAQLLGLLADSAAYSRVMDIKGQRMVEGDFEPASRIAQHAKDVGLILELARETGASTPLQDVHARLLGDAIARGYGDLDNAAIIRMFSDERQSN